MQVLRAAIGEPRDPGNALLARLVVFHVQFLGTSHFVSKHHRCTAGNAGLIEDLGDGPAQIVRGLPFDPVGRQKVDGRRAFLRESVAGTEPLNDGKR